MPLGSRPSSRLAVRHLEKRVLLFLPHLFSITDPHAGFSSQNLKLNHVSNTNSFDFTK